MPPMPRGLPALSAAFLVLLLTACETREVSRTGYGNPTELTPIPTRIVDSTPANNAVIKRSGDRFDPLGDIGRGLANLMPDKKSNRPSKPSMQTRSADGRVDSLPPGYTGTSDYRSANGNNYKLKFKDGALTGVEGGGSNPKKPGDSNKTE